mmetsp:Transcript_18308/g.32250  ORF Transcript_18308/g.32250 Transcript_18308/m.32250 type:complete len:578 (-) Transcript_18308:1067-2800(-)|eukprot:CAMPEP_0178872610 /NCGR_PEP_ID=MMETSP0747-20121128/8220_1 /TAXON_ID=913974 /ORGANISM="Nitzschia punctata, Strain CCMP561" /LENGTH=577 /DNA_ID=CAMNT_0020539845 /DNA_START=90 /DNA_END=1823 /DNA_ORIENTATION=+
MSPHPSRKNNIPQSISTDRQHRHDGKYLRNRPHKLGYIVAYVLGFVTNSILNHALLEPKALWQLSAISTAEESAFAPTYNDSQTYPNTDVRPLKDQSANYNATQGIDRDITIFPESMTDVFVGMGRVPREDFAKAFDIGYGIDPNRGNNNEVLVLYQTPETLPSTHQSTADRVLPKHSVEDAFVNCETVRIVLTDAGTPKDPVTPNHCIAVMGQWGSHHVHEFSKRRGRKRGNGLNFGYKKANRLVNLPTKKETAANQETLKSYLNFYQNAQEKLKPLAEKIAYTGGTRGPIVVMVSNYGQAQFVMNFHCSAKARGLDTSRVLLFATDQDTYDFATSMGITTFYDDRIFASVPQGAAIDYDDVNYGKIMMSKVYCVHLINSLGYDLLFQDADLVWYKDPLEYFKNRTDGFDMYFQHDGDHHPGNFKPLAANTGFYYVRYNKRTEYFFDVFVRMGDLVLNHKSHQAAFTIVANEHMALRSLRIKVLAEDQLLFMSGYHLFNARHMVKKVVQGKYTPYLYHANWLAGNNKKPTLASMLNWFVNDTCYESIPSPNNESTPEFKLWCCLTEPLVTDGALLS